MLLLAPACFAIVLLALACRSSAKSTAIQPDDAATEHAGVHNVIEVVPGLLSGSVPEGEAGFATLHEKGVRTVLSVDGATPDVERARRLGMRYVHLPIGYHGIDPDRQLELARAIRDLPQPIYLHCHHGKHRGPTAAATAAVLLDQLSPEQGIAFMKQAGTSPNYAGLYQCVQNSSPVGSTELDQASADFPEIAPVPGFTKAMAETQVAYDHLVEVRDAGWQTPAHHPDLIPLAEAGRLENLLRMLRRDPDTTSRSPDYQEMMTASWQAAQQLEAALAREASLTELTQQLSAVGNSCRVCHVVYRNNR